MVAFIYDQTANNSFGGMQSNLNNGGFNVMGGVQPTLNVQVSGQLILAKLLWGSPSFNSPTASGGIATSIANVITSAVAVNSGIATWFNWFSAFGQTIMTGTIGAPGSRADLILNTVNITKGGLVTIQSVAIQLPET